MSISTSATIAKPNKHGSILFLALMAAGLVGNYFKYPVFLNIDFLFGSIFAMLALQFFGLGKGILAAAMIASYTYIIWNHPYAIIIMTAEVMVVGLLMRRRKIGMVLADTIYWLTIGMPLVYLFYHIVMHIPASNAYTTMAKQGMNGIANALIARLIFSGYSLKTKSSNTSFREIVYNLLAFFVLCPTIFLLMISSKHDFAEIDRNIRSSLKQSILHESQRLTSWVSDRKNTAIFLADMATSNLPQQMQPHLKQVVKSDSNFLRIGIQNKEAGIVAYFPLIDELGHQNIGKSFADRPYYPIIKKTLKPMLSEVVMGRMGTPKPFVAMLAPVIIHGEYDGCITGILNLDKVRENLDKCSGDGMLFTLLDKNGNVIMTSRSDQKVMTPFIRNKGTLNRIDNQISQWIPELPANTPTSEQWKKSLYVVETTIGDLAEWKLILEQPVAPFQKALYENYTGKLTLLFLILLAALALAEFLSRKIVVTLEKLRILTNELPTKLETDAADLTWPESGILEMTHLICNFKEMANSLTEQFIEIRQINASLERRVQVRTEEYRTASLRLLSLVEGTSDIVAMMDSEYRYILFNTAFHDDFKKIFGKDLKSGDSMPEALAHNTDDLANALEYWNRALGGEDFTITQQFGNETLARNWYELHFSPIRNNEGNVVGAVDVVRNISERMRIGEALLKSEAKYRQLINNIPYIIYSFDLNGGGTFYSPATQSVLGYSPEYLLEHPKCWRDSIHPDDLPNIESAIEDFKAGVPFNLDYRFRHADGHWVWINDRSTDLPESEVIPTRIEGIAKDITERKLAEELQIKFTTVVDCLGEGIIIKDLNHKIKYQNRAITELFCDLIGTSCYEIFGLSEPCQDCPTVNALIDGRVHFACREHKQNGGTLHIESTVSLLRDSCGEITGTIEIMRDISERIRSEQTIRDMAFRDPLTGLTNRRLFEDRLEQAIAKSRRSGIKFGLMYLDLDHFKAINDSFGHDTGDLVLVEAAERITTCCKRDLDTISRHGGDEFCVIVADCGDREQLTTIAEKLLMQLSQPFQSAGSLLKVTTSVGISIFPDNASTMKELEIASDMAMYAAKKAGRNTYCFWESIPG